MLDLQEIELKITNLKVDLEKASTQSKKETLSKQIAKLNRSLEAISAYEAINIQDTVFNGDPTKLGIVTAKEIQNELPVIWVNWNGLTTSSVPNTLTVVPSEQLKWQWIEDSYTRLYDHEVALRAQLRGSLRDRVSCDDMAVLWEELERLKTEQKVLSSQTATNLMPRTAQASEPSSDDVSFSPLSAIKQNETRQEKIIELWEDAISFHYPLDSGFFLHNRKVIVRSYQLSKQHNLVFPVVFDGEHEHLAHPLELKKIPLGQINLFPKDNADPDEPEEENNEKIIIDSEFKNLLRPLTEEEYEQLEKNLIKDRCPVITIWKGHNTIIDGHHSYAIAQKHNIPYTVREVELDSRSAVLQWMYSLQLGRRNLSESEKSYYRAKQYESLKQERGGDRKSHQYLEQNKKSSEKSNCHAVSLKNFATTAKTIAEKTGVTERTIHRDNQYAKAVDTIATKLDISPQEIIHARLSKKAVSELKDEPVKVIKQKLANPKAKPVRDLPKLEIGQLVQIKSDRTNKDLVGYNKSYAVVKKLKRTCADIDVWGKLLTDIHLQFLNPVEDKVAICANISPDFFLRIMANYESFDSAVEHIPVKICGG